MKNTESEDSRGANSRPASQKRRGATAVEFAFIAPVIFLLLFACIEFCRVMMVTHTLEEAARAGCRNAILEEATSGSVEDTVESLLLQSGIDTYTLTISPDPPQSACQFEPITVSISARYADISWLPPMYMQNKTFKSSCTLPREGTCSVTLP